MPLSNDAVVFHKGFYTSTKSPIMEKHGNLYGNFAFSLDYVLDSKTTKNVMTARKFVTRRGLEALLDTLFDTYGNYHLNYLIFFSTSFFDDDVGEETYNTEMNKYIMRMHGGSLPQHVPFDKNTLYGEFHTIRSTLKTKKFLRQSGKMLFVNDNIYTIYVHTGMNKDLK
jgi:hypothetical protein